MLEQKLDYRNSILTHSKVNWRAIGVMGANQRWIAIGLFRERIHAHGPFDLVFANILLGPLRGLARSITSLLAPGGRVILSGLLAAQANAALAAYLPQGLAFERRIGLEGWMTLILRRRA